MSISKNDFQDYHSIDYFLKLIDTWLTSQSAEILSGDSALLQHIREQLDKKNNIDTFLGRKNELHLNSKKKERISAKTRLDKPSVLLQQADTAYTTLLRDWISLLQSLLKVWISFTQSHAFTTSFKVWISFINGHRLDMVWSRVFIETILEFFSLSVPELKSLIQVIAIVNGLASYGFYIVRGGADALPALNHLLSNKKYEELEIGFWDRLKFQAEQRYQRIINDLVLWAPVNYITFHHWTGAGWPGFAGNLLTAVLLLGDFSLNCYVRYHKQRQFDTICNDIKKNFPDDTAFLQALKEAHQKTLDGIDFELRYQFALVVSFVLLWSPFLLNSMFFTVIGAVACLGLQLFVNQSKLYLDYSQALEQDKPSILYAGLNRLFIQLLIPSVYLVTGLLIMPMLPMLSAPIMFALATAFIAILVKFNNYMMTPPPDANKEKSPEAISLMTTTSAI